MSTNVRKMNFNSMKKKLVQKKQKFESALDCYKSEEKIVIAEKTYIQYIKSYIEKIILECRQNISRSAEKVVVDLKAKEAKDNLTDNNNSIDYSLELKVNENLLNFRTELLNNVETLLLNPELNNIAKIINCILSNDLIKKLSPVVEFSRLVIILTTITESWDISKAKV